MTEIARIPIGGGGTILVETTEIDDGPVKAGRIRDAVHDLPTTLQAMLEPVTETARILLDHLSQAKPAELEVEFGIDLASEAGAVITKTTLAGHLKVKMLWKQPEPGVEAPN